MWWDDDEIPEDERYVRHLSLGEMLRRTLPLFRPHRRLLLSGLCLMLVSVAAELAGLIILRRIIDVDIANNSRSGILRDAVFYASFFAVGVAAGYFQVVVLTRMGLAIVTAFTRT